MREYRKHVLICGGPSKCESDCGEHDVETLRSELISLLKEMGLRERVKVSTTNCLGAKEPGPIMVIYPEGIWYKEVTSGWLQQIAEKHLAGGEVVEPLLIYEMAPSRRRSEGGESVQD